MKIVKITKVKVEPVYAIETSTETYIADGLAHHNCSSCNMKHENNTLPFTQWILKTYGQERLDYLDGKVKEYYGTKWFNYLKKLEIKDELQKIIDGFKKETN